MKFFTCMNWHDYKVNGLLWLECFPSKIHELETLWPSATVLGAEHLGRYLGLEYCILINGFMPPPKRPARVSSLLPQGNTVSIALFFFHDVRLLMPPELKKSVFVLNKSPIFGICYSSMEWTKKWTNSCKAQAAWAHLTKTESQEPHIYLNMLHLYLRSYHKTEPHHKERSGPNT